MDAAEEVFFLKKKVLIWAHSEVNTKRQRLEFFTVTFLKKLLLAEFHQSSLARKGVTLITLSRHGGNEGNFKRFYRIIKLF